jgi:hypothetical protein
MVSPSSEKYKDYVNIRKKNLHKMKPIPVCKFDGKTLWKAIRSNYSIISLFKE